MSFISSPPSVPMAGIHRVHRKPPPKLDPDELRRLRYPAPDPDDPFAPLCVLRQRSSASLLRRGLSNPFDYQHGASPIRRTVSEYPTPPSSDAGYDSDSGMTPAPRKHYRKRSQSMIGVHLTVPELSPPRRRASIILDLPELAVPGTLVTVREDDEVKSRSFTEVQVTTHVVPAKSPRTHSAFFSPSPTKLRKNPKTRGVSVPTISAPISVVLPASATRNLKPIVPDACVDARTDALLALEGVRAPVVTVAPSSTTAPAAVKARHRSSTFSSGMRASMVPPPPPFFPPELAAIVADKANLPAPDVVDELLTLPLISGSGVRVTLGEVLGPSNNGDGADRIIMVFLRHSWCPFDQDYMIHMGDVLKRLDGEGAFATPATTGVSRTQLLIISNGSYKLISKYMSVLGLKHGLWYGEDNRVRVKAGMYVDPGLALYRALGLQLLKDPCTSTALVETAKYIKRGTMNGIAMVLRRAFKGRLPLWEKGGHNEQLGGQFVMTYDRGDSRLTCAFAHRMMTPRDHASIVNVLQAAGVISQWAGPLVTAMSFARLDGKHAPISKRRSLDRATGPTPGLRHSLSTSAAMSKLVR